MLEYMGTVENGSIRVDDAPALPEGARVKIVLEEAVVRPTIWEKLLAIAGTVTDMPKDAAGEPDHYITISSKQDL